MSRKNQSAAIAGYVYRHPHRSADWDALVARASSEELAWGKPGDREVLYRRSRVFLVCSSCAPRVL
ncbi:MAG: hypothetical protein NT154_24710, partial [Verrucomicrobia bacterium]|nr:hypothetical protein [Verrucomicrobiota bacterium]